MPLVPVIWIPVFCEYFVLDKLKYICTCICFHSWHCFSSYYYFYFHLIIFSSCLAFWPFFSFFLISLLLLSLWMHGIITDRNSGTYHLILDLSSDFSHSQGLTLCLTLSVPLCLSLLDDVSVVSDCRLNLDLELMVVVFIPSPSYSGEICLE